MAVHKSLRLAGGVASSDRSVWTRRERLERLTADGRVAAEASPLGLPKVRTKFKVMTKKQKKDKDAAKSAEGAETAADATPAAE
jgi:small basic protein (TIGR04137 family)